MEPIIKIRQVNHYFGTSALEKQVLFNINLDVNIGEIVIMTGPSGSGKTTLLTLLGGLRAVQSGQLTCLGRELAGASENELVAVRRNIGYIFQAHNLLPFMTAQQNVCMSLEMHKGVDRQSALIQAQRMLDQVGLGSRLNYYPDKLSGGQKQRVAIARALVHQPQLVLADEPTASLDKKTGRDVVDIMYQLVKQQGCTILLVTHDNRILDIADRIIHMEDGQLAGMENRSQTHAKIYTQRSFQASSQPITEPVVVETFLATDHNSEASEVEHLAVKQMSQPMGNPRLNPLVTVEQKAYVTGDLALDTLTLEPDVSSSNRSSVEDSQTSDLSLSPIPALPRNSRTLLATKPKNYKVVCIEEDINTLISLNQNLDETLFSIVSPPNPARALAYILSDVPDVILLTLSMPHLNGFEICSKLRSHPQLKHIPIILMPAKYNFLEHLRAKLSGASAYIVKSLDQTNLIVKLFLLLI